MKLDIVQKKNEYADARTFSSKASCEPPLQEYLFTYYGCAGISNKNKFNFHSNCKNNFS